MYKLAILSILMFASTSSYSWEVSEGVTINELVQWEGSSFLVVRLSSDNTYHAPLVDKELYSLILSLYMSGRSFTIYGYDLAENINGYGDSHKIHRINAN